MAIEWVNMVDFQGDAHITTVAKAGFGMFRLRLVDAQQWCSCLEELQKLFSILISRLQSLCELNEKSLSQSNTSNLYQIQWIQWTRLDIQIFYIVVNLGITLASKFIFFPDWLEFSEKSEVWTPSQCRWLGTKGENHVAHGFQKSTDGLWLVYWRVDIFDQVSLRSDKKLLLVRYWEFGILSYLQNWIMQDE